MATKKPIKETKYCFLMAQTVVSDEEYSYAIERIITKEKNQDEIRFAVYKEVIDRERLLVRPLDMEEDLLVLLLEKAMNEQVFSKKFIGSLKKVLSTKEAWLQECNQAFSMYQSKKGSNHV